MTATMDQQLVGNLPIRDWRQFNYVTSPVAGTATRIQPPVVQISVMTRDDRKVTCTHPATDDLKTGDELTISGVTQPEYNGVWTIEVIDSTHFCYYLSINDYSAMPSSPGLGAKFGQLTPIAQRVFHIGASGNTDDISIGPDSNANLYTVGATMMWLNKN